MLSGLGFLLLPAARCPLPAPASPEWEGSNSGGRAPSARARFTVLGFTSFSVCSVLLPVGAMGSAELCLARGRTLDFLPGFRAGHPQDTAPTDTSPSCCTAATVFRPCSGGPRAALRAPLSTSSASASSQPTMGRSHASVNVGRGGWRPKIP